MFRIKQTITSNLPPGEILVLFDKHLKGPLDYSFMVASTRHDSKDDAKLCLQIQPLQMSFLMPVYSCNIMASGDTTTLLVQPAHFRKVFTLFSTAALLFSYMLLTTNTGSQWEQFTSLILTLAGFGSASITAIFSYRYCTKKITSMLRQVLKCHISAQTK